MSVLHLQSLKGKTIADVDHGTNYAGIEFARLTTTEGEVYEIHPLAELTKAGARLEGSPIHTLELNCSRRKP